MEHQTKTRKQKIREYFSSIFDMRSDMLGYDELHNMMEENIVIHGANMWILMLAILIASIGLNVNSTAVIIGAMLISPLMSGILTMGYSLGIRDLSMLKQAALGFTTQVVISLAASTIYFTLSPLKVATSEMIARTSPTLWDVLIAIFGGIAGSIGNTRRKISNVIPGVAIATALMPPLCTVGYGIATRQLAFIIGAFYLFVINTLFIALSAFTVTKLLGVPVRQELDEKRQKQVKRIMTTLVIVTVVPSILSAAYTVYRSVLDRNISEYLASEFVFADTQLVQSNADVINREIAVSLVGEQISDAKIRELEEKLTEYNLLGFTLHVTQNKSIEGEDSDKVTIAVQENTIRGLQEQLDIETVRADELEKRLEGMIDYEELSEKAGMIFTKLSNVSCGLMYEKNGGYVLLVGETSESLTDYEEQVIRNFLSAESGISDIVLQIREAEAFSMEEDE
ncbi:MAG: DUF389 domain-containing protein [Roseburia sp.]|nr:DUF389 domain-containing protein [Roseburia sp.]